MKNTIIKTRSIAVDYKNAGYYEEDENCKSHIKKLCKSVSRLIPQSKNSEL
jgi:hypothetical protein